MTTIPNMFVDCYTKIPHLANIPIDALNVNKIEELKGGVREMLASLDDPLECLIMIDTLEQLGIAYHFEEQIEGMLSRHHQSHHSHEDDNNLYGVALHFRLFRQHGYYVSPDLFNKFKDGEGRFKQELREDIKGLLSLYEASHLSFPGEDILDEAYDFARGHLAASITYIEPSMARQVEHALNHPMHMSLQRFDARHHIETSCMGNETSWHLVELSMLDFNFVQSMHQRELLVISKWWADLELEKEFKFGRVQPLKWFMWPMAMLPEPQFSNARVELTKVIGLIYILDDIYDVYGTIDELVLLTEAISRWEFEATEQLPRYMKMFFLSLYDITNEIGHKVMKEHGWNAQDYLRNSWGILSKAFLVEAKWFRSKYVPGVDEYLSNGVTSSGVHVVLAHLFFLLGNGITDEIVYSINNNPRIISCPATILRLWDDLGTSTDEKHGGYDGSYIECYMKERHSSLETARKQMMNLINSTWKELNEESVEPNPFPRSFTKATLNSARMVQVMHQLDDDNCLLNLEKHIKSLLIETISIPL